MKLKGTEISQCGRCKWLNRKTSFVPVFKCKAFPDRVPEEIFHNKHDHTKPFKGDHGIQFEQKP